MRIECEDQFLTDGPPKRKGWVYWLWCWRVSGEGHLTRRSRYLKVITGRTKREANQRLRRFVNQKNVTLLSAAKARRIHHEFFGWSA